jgi:glycosyltransferase involved in cell wall biosynthesis
MNNVGQFRALIAGMEHANGNYILTIDDDLQHAPEDIPLLYHKLKENPNLDVVIGATKQAQKSTSRKVLSSLADSFNGIGLEKKKGIVMSSFRCMNKALVNAILNHQTIFPVMGPMILKCTNRIENVEVSHFPRAYGKSNYNFIKLFRVSLNHVFNFSSLPLKLISLLGIFLFTIGSIGLICCFLQVALTSRTIFSNPVLFALLLWCTGLILLSIGIIGEYLYRILQEVNKTPRYAIREVIVKRKMNQRAEGSK